MRLVGAAPVATSSVWPDKRAGGSGTVKGTLAHCQAAAKDSGGRAVDCASSCGLAVQAGVWVPSAAMRLALGTSWPPHALTTTPTEPRPTLRACGWVHRRCRCRDRSRSLPTLFDTDRPPRDRIVPHGSLY